MINNEKQSLTEKFSVDLDKTEMKRFGHKCCLILDDCYVVVCGGTGQDVKGRHRRLNSLMAVNLTNYNKPLKLAENKTFERCYHTFTAINSSTAFIFGGRKSPKEPLSDCYLINFRRSSVADEELSVSVKPVSFVNGYFCTKIQ